MVHLEFIKRIETDRHSIFYSIANLYENVLIGYGRRHYDIFTCDYLNKIILNDTLEVVNVDYTNITGEDPRYLIHKNDLYLIFNPYSNVHSKVTMYNTRTREYIIVPLLKGKNFTFISHNDEIYIIWTMKPLIMYKFDIVSKKLTDVCNHHTDNIIHDLLYRGGTSGFKKQNTNTYFGFGHTTFKNSNEKIQHDIYYWQFDFDKLRFEIKDIPQPPNSKCITDPTSIFYKDGDYYLVTAETDGEWQSSKNDKHDTQEYVTNIYKINLDDKKYAQLYCPYPDSGFFVYLLLLINCIYILKNHKEYFEIPIIEFDTINKEFNHYLDDNGKMFENYFEIKGYKLENYDKNKFEMLPAKFIVNFYNNQIQAYPYSFGKYKHFTKYYDKPYTQELHEWYKLNRFLANQILTEYLTINQHIIHKCNNIWNEMFNETDYVIGIHIRGSDKKEIVGGRMIHPHEYYPYIEYMTNKYENSKLFLATDDQTYFDIFVKKYSNRCKYINGILRSKINVFADKSISNNYKKGEDVLLDCLCLSKCNFIIKSSSAVSEFAIYFNTNLHNNCFDLQYDCSEFIKKE